MSYLHEPPPVKLVTSFIYQDSAYRDEALQPLCHRWGVIDIQEMELPFHYTDYYRKEMGFPLYRAFVSFERLIPREQLVKAKLYSTQIEITLAKAGGRRTINIDPGYVTDSQLILATGKNYSHRIYLGEGIFGDLTLIYEHKKFKAQPWTYPDYQSEPMVRLLEMMRKKYIEDKKKYDIKTTAAEN